MQLKTDHGIKLCGIYPGRVIQHLDGGKCKIFIPGVYPDEYSNNPDKLPDAEQAAPLFGGINKGNGCFSYPNIDAIVWCMFQNGDQNYPVYFAARLGGELAVNSREQGFGVVRNNYHPDDDPSKDTSKNGQDSQQHMINCGDTRVELRESGQVEITCFDKKKQTWSIIFMNRDGSVQISTSQTVQINTPQLLLNAYDSMEINTTSLVIRANNEIQINSPQFVSVNKNSFTVKSPSTFMDSKSGKFIAQGQSHNPLYVA